MKLLFSIVTAICAIGAFFSGFAYWIADSSYQDAERLRQHGEYCDVVVVSLDKSSPTGGRNGNTAHYYANIRPVNQANNSQTVRCGIAQSDYDELCAGKKLKAWVLRNDVLLDYGQKNAGDVARTMLMICKGFVLVLIPCIILLSVCLVRRSAGQPEIHKKFPKPMKRHHRSYSSICS